MMDHSKLIGELSDGHPRAIADLCRDLGVCPEEIRDAIRDLTDSGLPLVNMRSDVIRLLHAVEPLDSWLIQENMPERLRRGITNLEILHQVDSTSARLMRFVSPGDSGIRVCLAETQTGGRGRRGRTWISPYGAGVYLSVRQHIVPGKRCLGALSPLLAVNLADALDEFGVEGVRVKWPNDLVREGRKLGGILIETRVHGDGSLTVVTGMGLNYRFPAAWIGRTDQPIVDLYEVMSGRPVSRNLVAAAIIATVADTVSGVASLDVNDLPLRWRNRDSTMGKVVELRTSDRLVRGYSEGIDHKGRLLLRTNGGTEHFEVGDVTLRPAK
ncbi:MAG: biotin--[acetyl-CoA-carboxylase] ligase [Pseudomonadota bacterium]|nr:biotin--[acetyl-CoA-carboxylase] ligase [Pseudomonadota bacterium]